MIGYLIRGAQGWELLDGNGRFIARARAAGVFFACLELDVKRIMFGAYDGKEGWMVALGVLTPQAVE